MRIIHFIVWYGIGISIAIVPLALDRLPPKVRFGFYPPVVRGAEVPSARHTVVSATNVYMIPNTPIGFRSRKTRTNAVLLSKYLNTCVAKTTKILFATL